MKAIAIDEWGADPTVHDLPVPAQHEGEVLVDVRSASLNGLDVRI